MTTIQTGSEVLKVDALGRVRTTAERRRKLLDEFDKSGLSGPKFAALTGLKYQTLAGWLQRRKRLQAPKEAAISQPSSSVTSHTVAGNRHGGSITPEWLLGRGSVRPLAFGSRGGSGSLRTSGFGGGCFARLGENRMLSFSRTLKVFVALEACDMRKSFNGLYALASERLGEDPRQGALFVFSNRRHDRIKILYWDGTGLWVLSKRLEQGTFAWPKPLSLGQPNWACDPERWPCSPMEWNCAEPDCAPGMSARHRNSTAKIFRQKS